MSDNERLVQTCATIAAFVAVAAGYGAKPTRVQRAELALSRAEVGSGEAAEAYKQLKAALHEQEMQMEKLDTSNTMSGGMAKHAAQKPKQARRITKLQDKAPVAPLAPVTKLQDDGASDAAPAAAADAPIEDAQAAGTVFEWWHSGVATICWFNVRNADSVEALTVTLPCLPCLSCLSCTCKGRTVLSTSQTEADLLEQSLALADSESKIPDPEEAKRAAKEAAAKAGAAVNNFSSDAMKVRARTFTTSLRNLLTYASVTAVCK